MAGKVSITKQLERTVAERTEALNRTVQEFEKAVSTQRQTEASLRESEERSRVLYERSPIGIGLASPAGEPIACNASMCRIMGYSEEELTKMNLQALYLNPEERTLLLDRVRSDGQVRDFETELRRGDGTVRTVNLNITRLTLGQKEVFLTAAQDVTSRKQAEERLRVSETNYRSIFNSANDAIFIHDMETGEIVDVNAKMCELYGYSAEEIRHVKVEDLSSGEPPYTQEDALRWIRKAVQGEPQLFEWRAKDRQGRLFWVEVNLKRAAIGGGERLLAVVRDITQRKRMEEELARVQTLESLGILAGGIAHDFNNILTAVLANISMARTYGNLKEDISGMLSDAEMATLRAQSLTRQLLTFARGGAPVKKVFGISRSLRDTTQFALSGSNVRAEFSTPDDLWPVEADEGQISQVIQNIVINAEQAMPEGGTIRISVENVILGDREHLQLKPGKFVRICIQDQGCGIAEKRLPKIFDPFFTTKEKGRGLGLATAYSIVNRHDGTIQVDSELGAGTTFHVYLPASSEAVETGWSGEDRPIPGKGRILLIDDEEAVRKSGGAVLKRLGFEVEFAADGEQGIELYKNAMRQERAFDAVVMDLTIPGGMGGRETIVKLREIDPHAKVIVSSGYSDHPVMSDFRGYGFDGAVSKPYPIAELAKVIHEVLRVADG